MKTLLPFALVLLIVGINLVLIWIDPTLVFFQHEFSFPLFFSILLFCVLLYYSTTQQ